MNKWGALGDELLEWEGRFQDCINGSENWFEVSAKGLLQYKECPGNPVVNWKQGGYRNLINHLKVCMAHPYIPSSLVSVLVMNTMFWI